MVSLKIKFIYLFLKPSISLSPYQLNTKLQQYHHKKCCKCWVSTHPVLWYYASYKSTFSQTTWMNIIDRQIPVNPAFLTWAVEFHDSPLPSFQNFGFGSHLETAHNKSNKCHYEDNCFKKHYTRRWFSKAAFQNFNGRADSELILQTLCIEWACNFLSSSSIWLTKSTISGSSIFMSCKPITTRKSKYQSVQTATFLWKTKLDRVEKNQFQWEKTSKRSFKKQSINSKQL